MEQIREHEDHEETLKQTMQAREDRIVELGQERQYALDNVARLEENIRRRDAEAAEYSQRNLQREAETEELREQLSRIKREHASALEAALATKTAEADQQMKNAKERVGDLKDEIERLRRQIHELQQESADKEVKIVQITKQRAQDKQDLQGLNIALDSKQQELELVCILPSFPTPIAYFPPSNAAQTPYGRARHRWVDPRPALEDGAPATRLCRLHHTHRHIAPAVCALRRRDRCRECQRRQNPRPRQEHEAQ